MPGIADELLVKIAFLTLLFNNRLYMIVLEIEVDHDDMDLSLIVRGSVPDMDFTPKPQIHID